MKLSTAFPSNYLSAPDLLGREVPVVIDHVAQEVLGDDSKMIVYFRNHKKGLVLNITNARTIAEAYTDETDNWVDGSIVLFSMKVDFKGRMVDAIRLRVPQKPQGAGQPADIAPPPQPVVSGADPIEDAPNPPTDADQYHGNMPGDETTVF
jgi:hypothetical protein